MSEMGEAMGTAVEGGLFARVMGGRFSRSRIPAGSDTSEDAHGSCLNCGTALIGDHCHACGQKVHLHRTITAILHDLMHGVLHLDGKLFKTLPLLAFRPGQITRRYIDGERAKFVSPMAMFLFSVFLMFAIFQAMGLTTPTQLASTDVVDANIEAVRESVVERRDAAAADLAQVDEDTPADERAAARQELEELEAELEGLAQARKLVGGNARNTNSEGNLTGIEFIDEGIVTKWRENPSLMLYKMQANSYKFSWLLIPLSIPFVWLLFLWRRRFKAYDHAIFVTYSLAFVSLMFIALSVLGMVGVPLPLLVVTGIFVPPVHIYKQLRGTYGLGRFSAIWRLLAILLFINIVVVLFLQLLLVLGAF